MKGLVLLLAVLSLSSCNKGISKGSKHVDLSTTSNLDPQASSIDKGLDTQDITEYRKASGYSCKVSMIDGNHDLFIESAMVDGEKKYTHYFAANKDANAAIDKQLDFVRNLGDGQDNQLLASLGFSKRQIAKIADKNGKVVETKTVIFFDESELTGYVERTAEARNEAGKIIRESTLTIGELDDCMEADMDVEIQQKGMMNSGTNAS